MKDFDIEIAHHENAIERLRKERARENFRHQSMVVVKQAMDSILNQDSTVIHDDIELFPFDDRSVFTFGLPRGYGKTTFLLDRLRKNCSMFYTILAVPNHQLARRIVLEEERINFSRCLITTPQQNFQRLHINELIGEILVDEYDRIDRGFIEELVEFSHIHNSKIAPKQKLTVIRVGTPKL
jgi:hypothetical protein